MPHESRWRSALPTELGRAQAAVSEAASTTKSGSLARRAETSRGPVSAEFQYVFKKTLTLPYASDDRADTFRRMKTWVEIDCAKSTLKVLERTLLGEKGDRVAEGVPTALKAARSATDLDAIESMMLRVSCGGIQAAD